MSEILRIPKTFKRGGTFSLPVSVFDENMAAVNISTWTLTSELRSLTGVLIQIFTVTKVSGGTTGQFVVSATAAQTAPWPVGSLLLDVLCTDGSGQKFPSETMELIVDERITQ